MINQDRTTQTTPQRRSAAFTLIEILIVIALTAVLFALLLVPLVSALRYTQQAQIVTAAQDAARITKERITRELGSAVFVFDGTSHPFQTSNAIVAGDDRYTNFLDLPILNNAGVAVVAHAYNAKLDFVLPKLNGTGGTVDPTTNEPIAYTQSKNGSAIISNPSYVFPLAAGTTMIRYFVGLKDPTKPYNSTREGKSIANNDNTYVLYRAQFLPYNKAANGVTPNTDLFALRLKADGTPVVPNIPDLDDPDFFRYVTTNDVNWLNDSHTSYTAAEVTAHNARVDKWVQIAKTVIPGPNVDLILLPHNADNTLAYDTAGAFNGVAHSGVAHDPVADKPYPIINTSVTFRPATVSGSATPGTTSDYSSAGTVAVDQNGFAYVPTVYTATSQSWSLPYHVGVYPSNYNAATDMYYDTEQFAGAQVTAANPAGYPPTGPAVAGVTFTPSVINPGDILERRHLSTDTDANGTVVYDVTQGFPVTQSGANYTLGGTQFVPMTINPDTGVIMFAAPSLPNGPGDRYNRAWNYGPVDMTTLDSQNLGGIDTAGVLDLTLPVHATATLTDSPLQGVHILTNSGNPALTGVANAHIVPGSLRVTGPDQTSGPNSGLAVSYTEINSSVNSEVGDNQYSVDYGTSTLHLRPGVTGVSVVYDYQANMVPSKSLPSPLPSTFTMTDLNSTPYLPNLPMDVKVDYQTRDLIDVTLGVRIYDVTSNRAQVIPAETKIKIGNSNR